MAAVTGGVLIAACFESGWAPRNWSDGAFWATTAVEEHRSASKTVRMELIVQSVGAGRVARRYPATDCAVERKGREGREEILSSFAAFAASAFDREARFYLNSKLFRVIA